MLPYEIYQRKRDGRGDRKIKKQKFCGKTGLHLKYVITAQSAFFRIKVGISRSASVRTGTAPDEEGLIRGCALFKLFPPPAVDWRADMLWTFSVFRLSKPVAI